MVFWLWGANGTAEWCDRAKLFITWWPGSREDRNQGGEYSLLGHTHRDSPLLASYTSKYGGYCRSSHTNKCIPGCDSKCLITYYDFGPESLRNTAVCFIAWAPVAEPVILSNWFSSLPPKSMVKYSQLSYCLKRKGFSRLRCLAEIGK